MNWTQAADLSQQLERRWNRGQILSAHFAGEALFPLRLVLKKPDTHALTDEFDNVRAWIQSLISGSRKRLGFGYEIEWKTVKHRVHGRNQLPVAVQVPTRNDALRMIGKLGAARRFDTLSMSIIGRFPMLTDWIKRKPLAVLEQDADWPKLLAVLEHFHQHPQPDRYLRQLDIPGVDSKYIERRRGLIGELLDCVLPESAIDREACGVRNFSRRYGLREEPPLIRFRILDPALAISTLTDLSVPPEQFGRLQLPVKRVFITENKINGLAFPDSSAALVIFGLGYGLDRLKEISWLRNVAIYYWGDIDTHGFAILNRLRAAFPSATSWLMDRETLMEHRKLWGEEPAADRFTGKLTRLNKEEQALFDDLRSNRLASGVRLEQERIGFGWLKKALDTLRNRK